MRLRLDIAYLGTRFAGWQVQEGSRTVQGDVEAALVSIYHRRLRIHGAGRTDAGVHARGQVAHLDVPEDAPKVPERGLLRALNTRLQEDVRVTAVSVVPEEFHARFSAGGKVYAYRLRRADFLDPFSGPVEALAPGRLDVPAMRAAASALVGRRDFAPFSVVGSDPSTTVRTLRRLALDEEGTLLLVTAEGDGFLRGMVRRLVGTLLEVGHGRTKPEEVLGRPGPTAEARGLTLERVLYDAEYSVGGSPAAAEAVE
jgi:tRNA pseudouridine38-40 synthase